MLEAGMKAAPSAAVIIMAKQPRPGRTKTRLCPPFTPQQAADFFEALLKDTINLVARLPGVQLAVAISPPESIGYFQEITPPGALLLPVEGAHIGECLDRSLTHLLSMGHRRAIALNADGPSLPETYLQQAVDALEAHDVVLGPGEDGGYYLVGLKSPQPGLFQDIPWSTGDVLARTIQQAERLRLKVALTPLWYDVDSPADVQRLRLAAQEDPGEKLRHCWAFFDSTSINLAK